MYRILQWFLERLSGEFILTKWHKSNGGTVIIFRSFIIIFNIIIIASIIIMVKLFFINDSNSLLFDLAKQLYYKADQFAAVFGAVYFGLYSRFSSQWVYLSNLYNQIKQSETTTNNQTKKSKKSMTEWKAGFIEDASNLHMATKSSIAPIIKEWSGDPRVKGAFVRNTPGGEHRYRKLICLVNEACNSVEKRY